MCKNILIFQPIFDFLYAGNFSTMAVVWLKKFDKSKKYYEIVGYTGQSRGKLAFRQLGRKRHLPHYHKKNQKTALVMVFL